MLSDPPDQNFSLFTNVVWGTQKNQKVFSKIVLNFSSNPCRWSGQRTSAPLRRRLGSVSSQRAIDRSWWSSRFGRVMLATTASLSPTILAYQFLLQLFSLTVSCVTSLSMPCITKGHPSTATNIKFSMCTHKQEATRSICGFIGDCKTWHVYWQLLDC